MIIQRVSRSCWFHSGARALFGSDCPTLRRASLEHFYRQYFFGLLHSEITGRARSRRSGVIEPPPGVEVLAKWKKLGLVADEDYLAWGAIEREEGKWDWRQHDGVEKAVRAGGDEVCRL